MQLLAATNNKHKLHELKSILEPLGFKILSASDVGGIPEVIEDADSFEGNAAKKASEVALAKNLPVFSDDSGLCVNVLDGRPGIFSARYGGPGLDDKGRCLKLLAELDGESNRQAHFACAIAIASPDGKVLGTTYGKCEGDLATEMHGDQGFGYDPLFIPKGFQKSFAELGEDTKNSLSHRKNALEIAISTGLFNQLKEFQ